MENTTTYSQLTCLKFRYMVALCVPAYIWITVNSLQLSLGLIKKSGEKKKNVALLAVSSPDNAFSGSTP